MEFIYSDKILDTFVCPVRQIKAVYHNWHNALLCRVHKVDRACVETRDPLDQT